ncbi:MAG: glycosyltransferase [Jatrophihabitans sp.]
MSRFLFVVPPLLGHVNPARGLAAALVADGHQVAWVGSEMSLRPMLGPGAVIYRTGTRIHRPQADQGLASVKSLWERFIVPFTRFTLPAVAKAVSDYRPDVVVTDQATPAGGLVAHREGLPWTTLVCSTMELDRPFRSLPKVESWMTGQLAGLWSEAGLPEADYLDLRFSPHQMIVFATAAYTGGYPRPDGGPVSTVHQVGPAIGHRADDPDFDWDWLDPARKHVLVSVGTLAAELADGFYRRAVAALAPMADQLQAIVVAAPGTIEDPPDHVLVLPKVPQLQLLPRLDAVLGHGGLNTVAESLAHGVPLVIAPIRHDQPINARLVQQAGAGLRVRFARASPAELGTAVRTVLTEPGYRTAAERIRESGGQAGGLPEAARQVAGLVGRSADRQLAASTAIT